MVLYVKIKFLYAKSKQVQNANFALVINIAVIKIRKKMGK